MWDKFKAWAAAHPYLLGLAVFGVGLLLLYWFGFFGSKQQSSGSGTAAAYYAAETAAQNAAAATNIAQGQTEAANNQTNAQRDVALAQIAASQEVADKQSADQLTGIGIQADYLKAAAASAVTINGQNTAAVQAIQQIQANAAEYIAGQQSYVAATQAGAAVSIAHENAYAGIIMNQSNNDAAVHLAETASAQATTHDYITQSTQYELAQTIGVQSSSPTLTIGPRFTSGIA